MASPHIVHPPQSPGQSTHDSSSSQLSSPQNAVQPPQSCGQFSQLSPTTQMRSPHASGMPSSPCVSPSSLGAGPSSVPVPSPSPTLAEPLANGESPPPTEQPSASI